MTINRRTSLSLNDASSIDEDEGRDIADIFIADNPTLRRVFHPPPTIIRTESRIRNKGKNDSRSIKDEREICRSTGFIR